MLSLVQERFSQTSIVLQSHINITQPSITWYCTYLVWLKLLKYSVIGIHINSSSCRNTILYTFILYLPIYFNTSGNLIHTISLYVLPFHQMLLNHLVYVCILVLIISSLLISFFFWSTPNWCILRNDSSILNDPNPAMLS